MQFTRVDVQLETPWSSNLVFSTDGRRVFGLDSSGALYSATVPSTKDDLPVVRREHVPEGRVVAVNWLEERLATIVLEKDGLALSHGHSGLNLDPSFPARVPAAKAQVPLLRSGRLQPYLRWTQEVDQMVGTFAPLSLLRADDDQLYSISVWQEPHGLEARTFAVGVEACAMAGFGEQGETLVVGQRPVAPSGVLARWLGREDARAGVFLLSRQQGGGAGEILRLDSAVRAFIGYAGATFARTRALVGVASGAAQTTWRLLDVDVGHFARQRTPVVLETADQVVGVLADDPGQPALVVRDSSAATLSLIRATGRVPVVQAASAIREAAASAASPVLAYVTAEAKLGFAVASG